MRYIIYSFLLLFIFSCSLVKKEDKDNSGTLALLALLASSSQAAGSTLTTLPAQKSRDTVLSEYNSRYVASKVESFTWNGSTSSCTAGTVPSDVQTKVQVRINYFRGAVGLPDISLDSSLSAKAQEAALMMEANNSLNHNPPTSWTCYTTTGKDAAGASNLALGAANSSAIDLYIQDPGSSNYAAGHRRWVLYSKAKLFGSGSTSKANALYVIGNSLTSYPETMPDFISWPPQGYVVQSLVYDRWSFAIPEADFSSVSVNMSSSDGTSISLTKETLAKGYGDNTLVWVPSGINKTSSTDLTYKVTISGVKLKDGTSKDYSYSVTLIKP
ncbi:MAG: CAP domain-containing protein [Leptospiraceae bacterium]|nr:CAP domain-containing protein [Leptospiraceae bacterium]